jgi:hypothetical protein
LAERTAVFAPERFENERYLFGVRRQSEAATALWMKYLVSLQSLLIRF